MEPQAIDIARLTKRYGGKATQSKLALDAIDLLVPQGAFCGLLGPNGAGKSTLINILSGQVDASSAERIQVMGHDLIADPRGVKRRLGVVPQELVMDPLFAPWVTLESHAGLYGVPRERRQTEALLRAFDLWDKRHVAARRLSGGMKRRLMTCKALVHAPQVLILDEPTAGVDIELRQKLWAYVRDLNAQGVTILLTTHYLEEAEELCDELAIIAQGRIIVRDRTENLLDRFGDKQVQLELDAVPTALPALLTELGAQWQAGSVVVRLPFQAATPRLPEILAALAAQGISLRDLSTPHKDLAQVFLDLTLR